MMMSPLNILSATAPEVTSAASAVSRSPESACSTKSISPPASQLMGPSAKDSQAAAAAAAASAASLIHAFASANPQLANPSALAQMFPGFPLHMAAAFAGYANGSAGNQQVAAAAAAAAAAQHAQNPYGALYAQVQQQQLSSLISQAARQHQFMAMQSGKKLADFDAPPFSGPPPSKLSPTAPMHPPPPPPSHHLGHSPTSNGLYNSRNGAPNAHSNPLMPLTMLAKGQSSPNPPANSANSNSNSSAQNSTTLLSPILFSPLSASSAASDAAYKRKLGLAGPNEGAEVPGGNSNGSANPDSAFTMANFQRMASARQSPGATNSGTSAGANSNNSSNFICPICSESLDGVDINAHFYEELHKIDSLRKMAVWTTEDADPKNKDISPYEKFGTSFGAPNGSTSYQKKLQLPQSRWETFQRIRQNRHQRLSAFARFTRRKYETAYESMAAAAAASQHSPLGSTNPPSHLAPVPAPPLGPGSGFHHHSPSSSSTSSSSATTHRSPTMATSTMSPHSHASHLSTGPFDHHAFNGGQKVSPTGESGPDGPASHLPRNSPASMLAPPPPNSAAYPAHHPMFAQNPAAAAFLHPGLGPFYPSAYHAAAAAAAVQLQSSPTAATGPWSMASGYPGFPAPGDHFAGFNGVPLSAAANPGGPGTPKIWRSVDTEQLEAALSNPNSEDGKKSPDAASKKLKKDEDHISESVDVGGSESRAADQRTSRCSSNVSNSSHGGEEESRCLEGECGEDSNDCQTPAAITAVSDDSNHSLNLKVKESDDGDLLEAASNHSSRLDADEEAAAVGATSEAEEDDVDVVSSDSEANHHHHQANKGRSQKRPSSPPFDSSYPTKPRFSGLYHHAHHAHRHHSSESTFHGHHFSHSLVARSDSVGSATETTPVS